MAIEFIWHIEGQVALATLSGVVSTQDLISGNSIMSTWMDKSDAAYVHVLFDATNMQRITFSARESVRMLHYLNHDRMGGFVVFGTPSYLHPIVTFMGLIVSQLTRAQFQVAKNLDDAMAILHELDDTLTPA